MLHNANAYLYILLDDAARSAQYSAVDLHCIRKWSKYTETKSGTQLPGNSFQILYRAREWMYPIVQLLCRILQK